VLAQPAIVKINVRTIGMMVFLIVRSSKIISQIGLRHRPELYFCPYW
jgi:hypothetical protein